RHLRRARRAARRGALRVRQPDSLPARARLLGGGGTGGDALRHRAARRGVGRAAHPALGRRPGGASRQRGGGAARRAGHRRARPAGGQRRGARGAARRGVRARHGAVDGAGPAGGAAGVHPRRRGLQRLAHRPADPCRDAARLGHPGRGHGGSLAPAGAHRAVPAAAGADRGGDERGCARGVDERGGALGGGAHRWRHRGGGRRHVLVRGLGEDDRQPGSQLGSTGRPDRIDVMAYIVQKYGGTSVATPEKIRNVALRVQRSMSLPGVDGVCVVVSAMGHTTDELIELAAQITDSPPSREMDMLLSTGETITAPLLAMALCAVGTPAVSLTGLQAGIRTSGAHRKARIVDIVPERILDALRDGTVAVIAGFQGVTEQYDITTLGRGGSDTTAVALAASVGALQCEIYTDVRGVYTADPRIVPEAVPIPEISYEEMLEFAAVGAKVMHPRAVEIGEAYDMPIWVKSSFEDAPGTLICRHPKLEDRQKVRGIAQEVDVAKVTLLRVPDRPGIAAGIFGPLADNHINVDVILQNVGHDGTTDLSFTL